MTFNVWNRLLSLASSSYESNVRLHALYCMWWLADWGLIQSETHDSEAIISQMYLSLKAETHDESILEALDAFGLIL